jgi:hypothetical protein
MATAILTPLSFGQKQFDKPYVGVLSFVPDIRKKDMWYDLRSQFLVLFPLMLRQQIPIWHPLKRQVVGDLSPSVEMSLATLRRYGKRIVGHEETIPVVSVADYFSGYLNNPVKRVGGPS